MRRLNKQRICDDMGTVTDGGRFVNFHVISTHVPILSILTRVFESSLATEQNFLSLPLIGVAFLSLFSFLHSFVSLQLLVWYCAL